MNESEDTISDKVYYFQLLCVFMLDQATPFPQEPTLNPHVVPVVNTPPDQLRPMFVPSLTALVLILGENIFSLIPSLPKPFNKKTRPFH